MAQKGGRPKVTTDKVVRLLVACFQNGLTVRQACWQSGISHEAYYQRLRSDSEFADIMSKAQQLPSIAARNNVLKAIKKGDLSSSKWWLERKDKEEFSSKTDVAIQEEVKVKPEPTEADQELIQALNELDKLIIYKYKVRKHALINNYCVGYGINKGQPLNDLYALPDEELLRLAHQDMANGTYDTPNVEGVFKADKPMSVFDDSKLPPHVKRRVVQ